MQCIADLLALQVYMHYPFEREVPSTLPKGELDLNRPFGESHAARQDWHLLCSVR